MDGLLLIDKETGMTSHDVVAQVRRLLNIKSVGHGGTLDPLATGVLVCLLGEATKLSSYVMAADKSYRVGVKLGVSTDSGDITGKIMRESDPSGVSQPQVEEAMKKLLGVVALPVPKFSAVKVKGKKLYEYARSHEDVEVPTKLMTIHSALLTQFAPGSLVVDLECEKGTYVRSWVERLGEILGCGATVESLRRTRSGPFSVESCVTLSDLKAEDGEALRNRLVGLTEVLGGWPALKVQGGELALLRNGQIPRGVFGQLIHFKWDHGVRLLTPSGNLLALAVKDPQKGVKLARVFNAKS